MFIQQHTRVCMYTYIPTNTVIIGPEDTPYDGGMFDLAVHVPVRLHPHPLSPPSHLHLQLHPPLLILIFNLPLSLLLLIFNLLSLLIFNFILPSSFLSSSSSYLSSFSSSIPSYSFF